METFKKYLPGMLLCLLIAVPAYVLGRSFPLIGGPVIAILTGMLICSFYEVRGKVVAGIKYTSKKILQYAVVLLGFGLDLGVVLSTGRESLPVIIVTISASLVTAFVLCKVLHLPSKICTLIGVGSSICGGSAIAAAAPVIKADDNEIAQALAVVFFFNVVAALIFPWFGSFLGMPHDAQIFGIFAGTAVNDTSSVTAAASTWDSMWGLGSETLDKAVTVKLTRTLAIIPICVGLSFIFAGSLISKDKTQRTDWSFRRILKMIPSFIVLFVIASLITTVSTRILGISPAVFACFKEVSIFMIVTAMAAVGLNCSLIKLIKTGAKPIFLGFCCWSAITFSCLFALEML